MYIEEIQSNTITSTIVRVRRPCLERVWYTNKAFVRGTEYLKTVGFLYKPDRRQYARCYLHLVRIAPQLGSCASYSSEGRGLQCRGRASSPNTEQ